MLEDPHTLEGLVNLIGASLAKYTLDAVRAKHEALVQVQQSLPKIGLDVHLNAPGPLFSGVQVVVEQWGMASLRAQAIFPLWLTVIETYPLQMAAGKMT